METKNLDTYGHEPIPWTRARDALVASRGPEVPFFLATVRPDATPHVAGIGALWVDGTLWFVSGPRTGKSRNLAASPACAIAVRLPGLDVVLEGHGVPRSSRPLGGGRRSARRRPNRQLQRLRRGDQFLTPFLEKCPIERMPMSRPGPSSAATTG
jgi:hypothetical protein